MILSTKHTDAVAAAIRVPALNARLALLAQNTTTAKIHLYPTPRDDSGTLPSAAPVVSIPMSATAGTVNAGTYQLTLDTPMEATIDGAGESGTAVTWAYITDGAGDWWGNASVTNQAGSGEIKLVTTTLYDGETARVTSAVISG